MPTFAPTGVCQAMLHKPSDRVEITLWQSDAPYTDWISRELEIVINGNSGVFRSVMAASVGVLAEGQVCTCDMLLKQGWQVVRRVAALWQQVRTRPVSASTGVCLTKLNE